MEVSGQLHDYEYYSKTTYPYMFIKASACIVSKFHVEIRIVTPCSVVAGGSMVF